MRRILRQREVVVDDWRHLGEEGVYAAGTGAPVAEGLIVPFSEYRSNAPRWRAYQGRLGVRLAPADAVEDIAQDLQRLSLVAVEFPSAGEGRGYSQGRLLRARLRFKGELRAVGAGVKQDLIFLMARCGFDSFELAPGQTFEDALRALDRYSVAYQPAEPLPSITQQRFFAA
jgi:uncharacterized protein (DUF934 family)